VDDRPTVRDPDFAPAGEPWQAPARVGEGWPTTHPERVSAVSGLLFLNGLESRPALPRRDIEDFNWLTTKAT
jgi:hypothetical protein